MNYLDKILSQIKSISVRLFSYSSDWVELNSEHYFNTNKAILINYPKSSNIVEPPLTMNGDLIKYASQQVSIDLPISYLAVSTGIKICTNEGFVLLPNKKLLVDTFWSIENYPEYLTSLIYSKDNCKHLKGDSYSVLLFWGEGYYHWLCDVLPRFYQALPNLPKDVKLIVPANLNAWQKNSLLDLGMHEEQLVSMAPDSVMECERLWYNPPVAMTGDHHPDIVNKLHGVFTDGLDTKSVRYIYISRKKAQKRHIVNEEELFAFLQTKGFELFFLEDLSWYETKKIFHQAICVVAPHGAGLANILFSQSGTNVVEIFEKNTHRRCFQTLAVTREINHYFYQGETVDIGWPTEYNIYVPMEDFKEQFNQWWDLKYKE